MSWNGKHRASRTPLERARFDAGLSQTELGKLAGLSLPTVGKVEKTPWECAPETVGSYIDALPARSGRTKLREWANEVIASKQERQRLKGLGLTADGLHAKRG